MVESGGVGDFLLPAPAGTVLGRGPQLNVHAVLEWSIFVQKSLWTGQLNNVLPEEAFHKPLLKIASDQKIRMDKI